jgi:hypothetical protein
MPCLITEEQKHDLETYLSLHRPAELINTYLYFIQLKFNLQPVLFVRDKIIYQSQEDAVRVLEQEGKLWNETEIKISFDTRAVNEQTKKIYICPFCGKVFGDNTHPNPQDAIYEWVSKCPKNTERVGGLKVKRFYVSDDPEVIKNYMSQNKAKEAVSKTVYSSALSGKLFNTKEAVIRDFKKNYLKNISMAEVHNQDKFQIDGKFLEFIQKHLEEGKITEFVEAMSEVSQFQPIVEHWLE